MSRLLSLFCYVLGTDPNNMFQVHIEPSQTISHLKDAIKAKNSNKFRNVGANQLLLWKVAIAADDIYQKGIDAQKFDDAKSLRPSYKLSHIFSESPLQDHVSIVVKPPADFITPRGEPPAKRLRGEEFTADNHDILLEWDTFWCSLWAKGSEGLEACIKSETSEEHGAFETMSIYSAFGLVGLKNLLIREEWKKVWKEAMAEQALGTDSFIIIGHPGIGRTLSLYYLLVMRVVLGLPTFFQVHVNYVWFFHSGGVKLVPPNVHWMDVKEVSNSDEPVWALVDSNESMNSPARILWNHGSPIFIVQAAYPRESRWRWTKDHGLVTEFYTKPFSLEEMLQGNMVQAVPSNPELIRKFYIMYGPSARDCYTACRSSTDFKDHEWRVEQAIQNITWDVLGRIIALQDLSPACDQVSAPPHFVILIEPTPENPHRPKSNVITRTVMNVLWKFHKHHIEHKVANLYIIFLRHPESSTTAGFLFEKFIHEALAIGIDKSLIQLKEALNTQANVKNNIYSLTNIEAKERWKSQPMSYVSYVEIKGELTLEPDHLYVAVDLKNPSFDSFTFECISTAYEGPILNTDGTKVKSKPKEIGLFTIFQVTIATKDYNMEIGLNKILRIATYQKMKSIAIRYIAVIPPGSDIKITIPVEWQGKMQILGLLLLVKDFNA